MSLTASQRRNSELGLGLLAVIITVGGYILVALAEDLSGSSRRRISAATSGAFARSVGRRTTETVAL